jgi:hypothetical protein
MTRGTQRLSRLKLMPASRIRLGTVMIGPSTIAARRTLF